MKVGIVGSGFVGATAAYALVMRGVGRQIVLVDKNRERAAAEADDLFHAVPFAHSLHVRAGEYADLARCAVVIIAAGVNQRPGETRLELLERNAAVFAEIVPEVLRYAPDAILVVATNPVDVMTHVTARLATAHGVAVSRVLGSGTTLDTARFRTLLAEHFGIDSHHVHGFVLGEHGDSEVLTWSLLTIAGMTVENFCSTCGVELDAATRARIDKRVRRAAYSIIQGKGATYYGIGSALARIVQAILHNQRAVLTVCSPVEEAYGVEDVTLALPNLVGGSGIVATFRPRLSEQERQELVASAGVIKSAIDSPQLRGA